MRIRTGLPLAAVCLALVGCATPGPKPSSSDDPEAPFTGAKLTRPARDPAAPPPEADVLLAGQVVEKAFGKRVPNASIQVIDLEDRNPAPAARLDFTSNPDGYFFIAGLQRGHHYQLIGRVKDGDRLLSGMTLAAPPNPRLSIYLSEDLTSPSTPAPLPPPTPPAPAAPPADKDAATPPAALSAPKGAPAPAGSGAAAPAPPLNRIADGSENDSGGFQKIPVPPRVTIPNGAPNPVLPPPPAFTPSPSPPPGTSPPSVDQVRHDGPAPRTAPPFCVLEGKRLDNFALPTVDGSSWEFRRDPPRKLVLLDFWKSNCGPCREAIRQLIWLQSSYAQNGLEVVGIAYEDAAAPEDQRMAVRGVRSRYGINYTLLMGADSRDMPCPVRTQFLVDHFPTLVLIDETGAILWRSSPNGLSRDDFAELNRQIKFKLLGSAR